jgi:hypothetical protein
VDAEHFRQMYLDQAPKWEWPVSTCYTPIGIQMLDGRFCSAIRAASTLEDCRYIFARLRENPHLHLDIKENLIHNLVNTMMAIARGEGPEHHVCGDGCFRERKSIYGTVWRDMICSRRHREEL